jgi:hypothetical protein
VRVLKTDAVFDMTLYFRILYIYFDYDV